MNIQRLLQFPNQVASDGQHPLCQGSFHRLMEAAQVVGEKTGWLPLHFQGEAQAILPGYLKGHSYGEFIFDWDWARFYEQHQIPYYPKLLHALPLTPVNAPKVLAGEETQRQALMQASFDFYQQHEISGEHYLFLDESELPSLQAMGFHIMHTVQYHWRKNWDSFEHYLANLSLNRRKFIKKERKRIKNSGLEIKTIKAQECTSAIMQRVYELYLSTVEKKHSHAYLNENFFRLLPEYMSDSLMLFLAYEQDQLIAMSLFFYGEQALYGRYWGIDPIVETKYPGLHFEMCYYLGMDYCFEHGIELFEAGAQGEHKLWRGFYPITIYSAHHLKIPAIHAAIGKYIAQVNADHQLELKKLAELLPYQQKV